MLAASKAGLHVVLQVHDEIVVSVPRGAGIGGAGYAGAHHVNSPRLGTGLARGV